MNILQSGIGNILLTAGTQTDTKDLYSKALLNTVLGMGTVFVVLIFISILIYFIKFIPIWVDKFTNPNKSKESVSLQDNQAITQFVAEEEEVLEEELVDDLELIAVITAAVIASMGKEAPADGLFVRSIRKVNGNRWKNA